MPIPSNEYTQSDTKLTLTDLFLIQDLIGFTLQFTHNGMGLGEHRKQRLRELRDRIVLVVVEKTAYGHNPGDEIEIESLLGEMRVDAVRGGVIENHLVQMAKKPVGRATAATGEINVSSAVDSSTDKKTGTENK